MATFGYYGWNPKQMERINARRMERGREPLINLSNIQTEEDYNAAQKLSAVSGKKKKSMLMDDEENRPSMLEESKKRTEEFRGKFKPKGSMAAEYGVKSRAPGVIKKGVEGGVGTSLQESFNRLA